MTFEFIDNAEGQPILCTATIHIKNRSHPVVVTEYLTECKRDTDPWNRMPHRMIRHRALCQAARLAFGFSGVKDDDEAKDIAIDAVVTAAEPTTRMIAPASEAKQTAQAELEALVLGEGFDFTTLQQFGKESGNIEDATSVGSFAEIPTDTAKRLLKAKAGLLAALKKIKEASNEKSA